MAAKGIDGETVQGVIYRHDHPGGGACLGDLNHSQDIGDIVHPCTAVFLWDGDSHEAQFSHFLTQLCGVFFCFVKHCCHGFNLVFRKALAHLLYHLLLFGQLKVHSTTSFILTFL